MELRALLAAMTPRPWAPGEHELDFGPFRILAHIGPVPAVTDADGVMVAVNLADDLVRLAELVRVDMETRGPHLRHDLEMYRHLEALEGRAAGVLDELRAFADRSASR